MVRPAEVANLLEFAMTIKCSVFCERQVASRVTLSSSNKFLVTDLRFVDVFPIVWILDLCVSTPWVICQEFALVLLPLLKAVFSFLLTTHISEYSFSMETRGNCKPIYTSLTCFEGA
jgi:hypothetical protein